MDCSRLRAISGMYTFSSKAPERPPTVMAASLPITCADTWVRTSHMTGLTLPGMIEEPFCSSGRKISASPARGPDAPCPVVVELAQLRVDPRGLRLDPGEHAHHARRHPLAGDREVVDRLVRLALPQLLHDDLLIRRRIPVPRAPAAERAIALPAGHTMGPAPLSRVAASGRSPCLRGIHGMLLATRPRRSQDVDREEEAARVPRRLSEGKLSDPGG